MDNPAEVILDHLRDKGWVQGSWSGTNGGSCIRGLFVRSYNTPALRSLESVVCPVIKEHYTERVNTEANPMELMIRFNDHPDTTFADVERVLEKAAVKWEEERVLRND